MVNRLVIASGLLAATTVLVGCASSSASLSGASSLALATYAGISPAPIGTSLSSAPVASPISQAASSPAEVTGTAAANESAANAEALRLLALATVPPGSTRLSTVPAGLGGPALGSPETSSLIDHSSTWWVPLPFADAVAWEQAHAPASLLPGGSARGTDGGAQIDGIGYGAPDSAAWQQAQLEIGVRSDTPSSSYIRVDGVALWLDPVPVTDSATGTRLRVAVAGGCPATDDGALGVTNSGPGLDAALLPAATPSAAIVCDYPGALPSTRNIVRLGTHQLLDASAAARLAAAARAIPTSHLDDEMVTCPAQSSGVVVLAFAYPGGGADVDLWWRDTGCQTLSNGEIQVSPSAFADAIAAAVGNPAASPPAVPEASPPASIAILLPPSTTGGRVQPPLHDGSPAAS